MWSANVLLLVFVLKYYVTEISGESFTIPDIDWNADAQAAIKRALKVKQNTNVAKKVILFLGDGLGVPTIAAGRIYAGQKLGQSGEEYKLSFEDFPYLAHSKTYNANRQVSDSAGTATAFLCGVKTNYGLVGVSQHVQAHNCSAVPGNEVKSIIYHAHKAGKRTGIVTTARITHATPAAAYAHVAYRDYEAAVEHEKDIIEPEKCTDIATQLIRNNSFINVIFGGGRSYFSPQGTPDSEDPTKFSKRLDDLDLIQEWKDDKDEKGVNSAYVTTESEFNNIDPSTTDFALGLFQPSHMNYELDRSQDISGEPSLEQLTEKAIKILDKGDNGYLLLVEGARIDHGHHDGKAKYALEDTVEFSKAVQKGIEMTNEEDTLIIVTADHSHVFTLGGYSSRGNPILGLVDTDHELAIDGLPYTTLLYANSPNANRTDLTNVDTADKDFVQLGAVPVVDETHGGEDVPIYAKGPMAHLFHGTQEQSYIAHAISYASCIGSNTDHCDYPLTNNVISLSSNSQYIILLLILMAIW